MPHYNPWPLGKLPLEWQRPEPDQVRKMGYSWDDPRDINRIFADKLSEYTGAPYVILTDSCSNAIFLSLKYREITGEIRIPRHTYVSVPMQIIHAGCVPVFEDTPWSGEYELGSTSIWDSAGRFTSGMFLGGDAIQCLSFQIKKRLPIGRGGAILTADKNAFDWLNRAVYDGRDLESSYDSSDHVTMLGWHSYMTPEDAARGILLLNQIPQQNADTMTNLNYPDITEWPVFRSK